MHTSRVIRLGPVPAPEPIAILARAGRINYPGHIGAACLRGPDPKGRYTVTAWATIAPAKSGFTWHPLVPLSAAQRRAKAHAEWRGRGRNWRRRLPSVAAMSLEQAARVLRDAGVSADIVRWRPWSGGYAGYVPEQDRLPVDTPPEVLQALKIPRLPVSPLQAGREAAAPLKGRKIRV